MDERTIIISSRDIVDHAVLARKRNELVFKKDFLIRSGAKEDDLHVKVIENELSVVEEKLKLLQDKLACADMLTIVPNRKEVEEYNQKINQYSRNEIDLAVKNRSGEVFELMKRRALIVRENFEKREDIARLTILVNSLARKDGEAICALIEEGTGDDADVSFLPKEKQQELVNLAFRMGRECCIFAGSFSVDKKKVKEAR